MTSAHSIFDMPPKPKDSIFGLNAAFEADTSPKKINLGIGVFKDTNGKIPALKITKETETRLQEQGVDPGYLPIMGFARFNSAIQKLILGSAASVVDAERVLTVQTLGGTGALSLGANALREALLAKNVERICWQSTPTWENHANIFERNGFKIQSYAYYNPVSGELDFQGMLGSLSKAAPDSVVILHACCHNPTGVDLASEKWSELAEMFKARHLIPFFDCAYQGFGDGIEADRAGIETFAKAGLRMVVAYSCSKNFSFYNERLGALVVIDDVRGNIPKVKSNVEPIVRGNYSNPPAHGARIVADVLENNYAAWVSEVDTMRTRIQEMRNRLVDGLLAGGLPAAQWERVRKHRGMFSYLPMNGAQVARLKEEHHIYALDSGGACRINVAALSNANLSNVADAILKVVQG